MYEGYITVGSKNPIGNPPTATEVINNARAYAYANNACIGWLHECTTCESAGPVLPGWPYVSPAADPAPWWDPLDGDSEGFLGIVGLEVTGTMSSTRQTAVTMGLNGIGTIGPSYMTPRTMVIRAVAIATDECSLQYGITWLRSQYRTTHNPCGGDTMTYFDCCPCLCPDDDTFNPDCWATTYAELKNGPACAAALWWPNTYDDLIVGPPADDPNWCFWVDPYWELAHGPPDWSCCTDACVAPYLRQFYTVRVTEGPTELSKPLLSYGAAAEIEFTIVAADPATHGMPHQTRGNWVMYGATGTLIMDEPPPPLFRNPYRDTLLAEPSFVPAQWLRETINIERVRDQVLPAVEVHLRVRAFERSGPVRLGLWAGDTRIAGYTIPFVAQNSSVLITGSDAYYSTPDGDELLSAFVRDWDDKWPRRLELPHGDYRLTVDQPPDTAVKLYVEATVVPVGDP